MTGETGDMVFQVSDVNPWQKILERERLHADRSLRLTLVLDHGEL